ncbi:MAG TPA: ubiquitin-like domain-containing protein [Jatrophihabitans sp.]
MLRSIKYGLSSAAVAGVVAGTVAFTGGPTDKTVHLLVDGQPRTVTTTAADVRGALAGAGLHAGAHDLLAPAAAAPLKNGETVVLKRGRQIQLSINGAERTVWTTAPTVAAALDSLGYPPASFTSVSRSKRLPLGVTDIALRTPKRVTVVHDGKRTSVLSTATDVGALLDQLSLHIGPYDRVSAKASTPLTTGLKLILTRVRHHAMFDTRSIPFAVRQINDSSMLRGHTQVITAGRTGLMHVSYAVIYVNGKQVGTTHVNRDVVRNPRTEVEKVGTKAPQPVYTGTPTSAQSIARSMMMQKYGWGDGEFSCLVQMWNNESGWRTNALNPSGAYGIPQSLPGSKMASAGSDWQTNAATQISWGLQYIASRYGTPCGAWGFWQAHNYY